jgi:hypothetical protein
MPAGSAASLTDGSIPTSSPRRDAYSFGDDIIEGCLKHPEGIVD